MTTPPASQPRAAPEDIHRALFDETSDALLLHDDDGRIVMVNARMCAMFGCSAEQALSLSVGDLSANLPPYTQQDADVHLRTAREQGSTTFDWQSRRIDGTTFWSEVALRRFFWRGERRIIACVRDIGARKQMESALRTSEQRFASIFHHLSSMLAFTEPAEGCIIDVNETWLEATGFEREAVLGKTGRDLKLWTDTRDRDVIVTTLRADGRVRDYEAALVLRGRIVPTLISAELVSLEDLTYILWEIRDVSAAKAVETEREKLRTQLLAAQKMESIGQLAGGIAHDFNNLLTVINGCSELLTRGLDRQAPSFELLSAIRSAGEQAAALTQQLLAFSRRQVMQPRALDLNALLLESEDLLRRLIGENIDLLVLPGPDIDEVFADRNSLQQVLLNLAVNARDAMPDGGRLTIETCNVETPSTAEAWPGRARPGRFVRLAVSDTGVGMDEVTQSHLFEPFYTTKPQGKGTGLGLSTVHGIIEQSGGYVSVYSEVGVGTTFKVHLPASLGRSASSGAPLAEPSHVGGHETILLVEDQAGVRHLAARILKDLGYTVLDAPTGERALDLLARHEGPVHVLLTDLVLPGISGRALGQRIADTHPEVRVVFMSGYTDDVVVRHGVLQKGVPFLQKPFSPGQLGRVIREVLDGR